MSQFIERIPGQESMMGKLRAVVETTAQLKARQRLTGRSGQLAYTAENPMMWDYENTLAVPTPPAYNQARFRVTFTGDGSQKNPIAIPLTDVRINGVEDVNKMKVVNSSGLYAYSDGSCDVIGESTIDKPVQSLLGDELQLGWEFYFQYRGTVTLRIKARAQASCPGNFAVTRVL